MYKLMNQQTGTNTMSEAERAAYHRVLWHSRRGMLELDILLEGFVRNRYLELSAPQQALYRQLGASVQKVVPGRDPAVATLAAWSLVHGLAHLLLADQLPRQEAVQAAQAVTELFVAGLGDT